MDRPGTLTGREQNVLELPVWGCANRDRRLIPIGDGYEASVALVLTPGGRRRVAVHPVSAQFSTGRPSGSGLPPVAADSAPANR